MKEPAEPTPQPAFTSLPRGVEREVAFHGSASIGGAPVAYVIVLSAVVAVLSFMPFSIALSAGNSFPMAQGIYPLMGWLLGPWAGAVAAGIGSLVGVFLAPHTAGVPWVTVGGATLGALFGGAIVARGRKRLGLALAVLIVIEAAFFIRHALVANQVAPWIFFTGYLSHFASIACFLLPTRRRLGRLIAHPDLRKTALGLFLGTWCAAGLMMFSESLITYHMFNWPGELFVMFAGVIPLEQAARSGIGAVIGTGVIAGLRAMALVKPRQASY